MRRGFSLPVIVLGAASCWAQHAGHTGAMHTAGPAPSAFAPGITSIQGHGFRGEGGRFPHAGFVTLGSPFWWGDGYSGAAPPTVVVLQGASAEAPPARVSEPEAKPADPLLIELQGDRYVRVSREAKAGATDVLTAAQGAGSPSARLAAAAAFPPTVFVYRDGRREESSDYSIIAGIVYARTDYWVTGAWSKQIPLAELDIPASLEANQQRGVKLVLPNSANEVVTRP